MAAQVDTNVPEQDENVINEENEVQVNEEQANDNEAKLDDHDYVNDPRNFALFEDADQVFQQEYEPEDEHHSQDDDQSNQNDEQMPQDEAATSQESCFGDYAEVETVIDEDEETQVLSDNDAIDLNVQVNQIEEDEIDENFEEQVEDNEEGEANVLRGNPNQQLLQDQNVVKGRKARKFTSMRQHYLYMFQMRDDDPKAFHWLWSHRTLAQEYTIVTLNRIEANEMDWQKKVQSRVTHPASLREALSRF
uniref:Uncharacterized protein n=1 Tax=Panagrolaimus sp. ES5 TaxID=591445 RepID=A0AC34G5R8_9BILA